MKLLRLLPLLLLAACAARPPSDTVQVAPGVELRLTQVGELGRSVSATQLVTARRGDQAFSFEGHLSAEPGRLLLVGLDPMGRRAMTVEWTAGGIRSEAAPFLPDAVRPENVLADIVMIYWPDEAVRRALSGVAVESRGATRRIGDFASVQYQPSREGAWSGQLVFRNDAYGYQLEVQSSEAAP
jgi:hypothetical protein